MQVEVRPLPIERWHGKDGKESFGQPVSIEVLYDSSTGKYATGLDEEETTKYSHMLGLDLSNTFDPMKPHPYWCSQAARIKLPNHTLTLETDKPSDYIIVKNLKASKFIANSMKEWQDGMYPEATHVIYDEQEEVTVKAGKVQKKNKCIAISAKMSYDDKANMIQVIGKKSVRGRKPDYIDVELDSLIEEKPDEFLRYSQMDKNEVYTQAVVLEAIHRNILTREGTAIKYMDDVIGIDLDDTIKWFIDPQNQKIKAALLEKLGK